MQTPLTSPPTTESPVSRRQVLAGLAATGSAASAGCAKQAHAILNRSDPAQVSLTIKTVPADDDPAATRTARYLAKQLGKVGVDASVELMRRENLLIDVLFKHSFDLYVWRLPPMTEPDDLWSLLHSKFVVEPGWQNPFGYADLTVDELLERQRRRSGARRADVLSTLQERLAQTLPFVTIAFPNQVRAVRNDRVAYDGEASFHSTVGYTSVDAVGDAAEGGTERTTTERQPRTLTMTLDDPRPTENLNPLATEYRDDWTITGLLYDSLARSVGGEMQPWLAKSVEWEQNDASGSQTVTVTLRDGCTWHDGEPVTAEDVAFTYEFLQDTSLGKMESPLPAPAFRGRTSLVQSVTDFDDDTVQLSFVPSSRPVAWRSLTVPVLPKHVWESTSEQANVPGVQNGPVTEALVRENMNPVGSGPLQFDSRAARNSLTLGRNDDHFLHREGPTGLPEPVDGFDFDRLRFQVVPSTAVARKLVLRGDADANASSLSPAALESVGEARDVSLRVTDATRPYHVGFNVRQAPLSNSRFRQAVARLVDRSYIVDEFMADFAQPSISPLPMDEWVPNSLQWSGTDPTFPFAGEDGELDVDGARQAFIDAGYRYSNGGKLVSR
ncbi:ABC transporter substrate-binding protein [Haloarchaeobius sp. TZWWS8]|uniref:ABC transporter substrate-binding protein n=1 Tax=Haloarchaeobius sp. TZWWS8 TaxID=3446121 RepID=UPI003EB8EC86